jgi:predicted DNA-binding protein
MASPLTLRLNDQTRRQVVRIARQRGTTASQVIREAIEALVDRQEPAGSVYEAMTDLIGVVRGGNSKRSANTGRKFSALLKARRVPGR